MIIILKKDGTVVTDDGNPVEGVKLENAAAILADPKDGDSIVYDATAGMWVAGTGGGSFDPDITNPQDGDTLVYDASEEKWVNGSGGGGSGGGYLKVGIDMQTMALDKTWNEIYDALNAGYYVSVVTEVTLNENVSQLYIYHAVKEIDEYHVDGCGFGSEIVSMRFSTDSENGYPVMQQ